jgi:tRNA A-37 threonylcarbamoyl transferase component Bud32
MSSVLDRIGKAVAEWDLVLTKMVPRDRGHILLEMVDTTGSPVAGQWFARRQQARAVAADMQAGGGEPVHVRLLDDKGVLLQYAGVDRKVPALHRLASETGTVLVSHRPERRGLVRRVDPGGTISYTKAVRPKRLPDALARARVSIDGVAVPHVTTTDTVAGTMTFAALPGRTLHDLLAHHGAGDDLLPQVGRAVGQAIARLHATATPPSCVPSHDAHAEVEVSNRWVAHAQAMGLLPDNRLLQESLSTLDRLTAEPPSGDCCVHGDLHDKQVIVDGRSAVGMLDFDMAARGEPALDLANLLVHLELRALQGWCTAARARSCAEAVVSGYHPTPDVWRRLPDYARATRLRLAAVYAFRPGGKDAGMALLAQCLSRPLSPLEPR